MCLLRYSIIGPTTLLATISEKMVNTEGIRIPTWDLKMRARFWKISNLDCRVCSCKSAIKIDYRIVASRSTSRLVTCLGLFRLLMKGIFGPYVLWPLDKKLIFWIVTRVRTVSACDYTVCIWAVTVFLNRGPLKVLYDSKYNASHLPLWSFKTLRGPLSHKQITGLVSLSSLSTCLMSGPSKNQD